MGDKQYHCKKCKSSICCCPIENENESKIHNNPKNKHKNIFKPTINVNPVINTPPSSSPVCPPPTLPNESPGCEQARQQISGDVFVASNGWEFGFINVQQDFLSTVDPNNPNSCQGFFGGGWHLAPIEELRVISNDIRNAFSSITFCPMLIWSTIDGVITLVYVVLESPDRFIVVPTTSASLSCPAYSICINSGG